MCHSAYIIAADRSSARLDYVLPLVVLRYSTATPFRDTMARIVLVFMYVYCHNEMRPYLVALKIVYFDDPFSDELRQTQKRF